MVKSFLLWLYGLILMESMYAVPFWGCTVCGQFGFLPFWIELWIQRTLIIWSFPPLPWEGCGEVVIVQLWLWFHKAKLVAQGLFQALIIHFKLLKRSRILWQIVVLQGFWNGGLQKQVTSFLTAERNRISLHFRLDSSEAVTQLRWPGAFCCPEPLGFATFVM